MEHFASIEKASHSNNSNGCNGDNRTAFSLFLLRFCAMRNVLFVVILIIVVVIILIVYFRHWDMAYRVADEALHCGFHLTTKHFFLRTLGLCLLFSQQIILICEWIVDDQIIIHHHFFRFRFCFCLRRRLFDFFFLFCKFRNLDVLRHRLHFGLLHFLLRFFVFCTLSCLKDTSQIT